LENHHLQLQAQIFRLDLKRFEGNLSNKVIEPKKHKQANFLDLYYRSSENKRYILESGKIEAIVITI